MLDHVLAASFALGFPLATTPVYLKRRPALLAGDSRVRRREYLETIAWLTAMGVAPVVTWLLRGRDLSGLGLTIATSWQVGVSFGLAVVISGLLFLQVRSVRRDPATRMAAREALAPVREFFATTPGEVRLFRGVSFAAGIGEEIYYRGFLLWYLAIYAPQPLAIVASSMLFGLAHVMHGTQAVIRSTLMGALLAGLYLFSGSLWASMVLHVAVDLSSGEMGVAAFADPTTDAT